MPAIWVGEVWYLGVICILVVAILLGMVIFVLSVCTLMINPRTWKEWLLTMLCLAAAASLFWLDDNYGVWFMD
jgi:hypothetical protein